MEYPILPAAREFVDEIRALYAKGLSETGLWEQIEWRCEGCLQTQR